jgi:hypothetical protein
MFYLEWKCYSQQSCYDFVECANDDFLEIPVSKTMISDHNLLSYYQQIKQILDCRLPSLWLILFPTIVARCFSFP